MVCCGCFPRRRAGASSVQRSAISNGISARSSQKGSVSPKNGLGSRISVYHDARGDGGGIVPREDSLTFFDALQDHEGSAMDETKSDDMYPIITTSSVPHVDLHISLDRPESLLRDSQRPATSIIHESKVNPSFDSADKSEKSDPEELFFTPRAHKATVSMSMPMGADANVLCPPSLDDDDASQQKHHNGPTSPKKAPKRGISSKLSHVLHLKRDNSANRMQGLQDPRVKVQERGYPGELSQEEVDKCVSESTIPYCDTTRNVIQVKVFNARILNPCLCFM